MKLVAISDTHQKHGFIQVPDGDVLIHCGDWTNQGTLESITNFLDWFTQLPHQHKIFIAGNHELTLDSPNKKARKLLNKYIGDDVHYLYNSEVIIDDVKFYGSPSTPFFYNWAFNFHRGKDIAAEWAKIPDDVNVLITHGPPYGILDLVENNIANMGRDLHQGCKDLSDRISQLKQLRVHVFGHLHTDGGKSAEVDGVIYGNAAICTERYLPYNKPIVIEL